MAFTAGDRYTTPLARSLPGEESHKTIVRDLTGTNYPLFLCEFCSEGYIVFSMDHQPDCTLSRPFQQLNCFRPFDFLPPKVWYITLVIWDLYLWFTTFHVFISSEVPSLQLFISHFYRHHTHIFNSSTAFCSVFFVPFYSLMAYCTLFQIW